MKTVAEGVGLGVALVVAVVAVLCVVSFIAGCSR